MSYSVLPFWAMPLLVLIGMLLITQAEAQTPVHPAEMFQPGPPMLDTDGKPIVTEMGGGFMIHDGVYYWFGEHKVSGGPGGHTLGVICYSSTRFYHWKNEGYVLTGFGARRGALADYSLGERPKVIYNDKIAQVRDVGAPGRCPLCGCHLRRRGGGHPDWPV